MGGGAGRDRASVSAAGGKGGVYLPSRAMGQTGRFLFSESRPTGHIVFLPLLIISDRINLREKAAQNDIERGAYPLETDRHAMKYDLNKKLSRLARSRSTSRQA